LEAFVGIRVVAFLLSGLLFLVCFKPVFAADTSVGWKITRTEWTAQDEKNFQQFVVQIGTAIEARQCATVTQCLNSSLNPYRVSDPPGLTYKSDCADFPYYLRGYFAWKNGLPFAFANDMAFRAVPGNEGKDIRYSRFGNRVTSRYSVVAQGTTLKDAVGILNTQIPDTISSANMRFHYADSNTDFYPVRISRDSIRPGTVIYVPDGHVAIVYRVADDGKVSSMDAHPDNSVTTETFSGNTFERSNPGHGAGFKNWRPLKLVGGQLSPEGYYLGGQIVYQANETLADFSVEQFFGNSGQKLDDTQWKTGKFQKNGLVLNFFDFVRRSLAVGNFKIDPLQEMNALLVDLCNALKDRVNSVNTAIQAGIDQKPHPERLPENIYGADGEWENFSTPGRDAQLKVSFIDILLKSGNFIQQWKSKDPALQYSGTSLPQDLLKVYGDQAMACSISYRNSKGQDVRLNLEEVRQRLFRLSFDPYHCIERRWGAVNSSETASCSEGALKDLWYEREQRLRNEVNRQFENKMDFTVEELSKPLPGNGVDQAPDVDIVRFLSSQN
jgi:hypothetical protein